MGRKGRAATRRDRSKISDRLGAITLGTQALRVVALAHHRKENKATYVAQEATKEGDSRTPRDPGMNAAPQSTNKLHSNNNQICNARSAAELVDQVMPRHTLIPLTRTKGFKKTTDVVPAHKELSRFQPAKRRL